MFFKILKKDLTRKKSMNIILFLFIVLCTLFTAGSLSNMTVTTGAIAHFAKVSHLSDYLFLAAEKDTVVPWLNTNEQVKEYTEEQGLVVAPANITVNNNDLELSLTGSILLSPAPTELNLALDSTDAVLTTIEEGEIALPYYSVQSNNLALGDTVTVHYGSSEKDFTLTTIAKDMVFGSPYMGISRFLISEADYRDLLEEELPQLTFFSIQTDDALAFERNLVSQGFALLINIDKSLIERIYLLDMVVAAILMAASILLLLIALVILRFTIAFTLQEDYREIGVMKAIGLKSGDIKKIYLTKYVALSIAGAALGIVASIPFSSLMTQGIQNNMALEQASSNLLLTLLAGVAVIVLVLLFCFLTMRRINKLSAVQAIRSGATGENYKTRKLYSLHRHRRLPLAFSLAVNDLLCNTKNYIALIITFVLGVLMVILPLNAINTLKSKEVINYFGLSESDVYITTNEVENYVAEGSKEVIVAAAQELEEVYGNEGIAMDVYVECSFNVAVYKDSPDESLTLLAYQAYNYPASEYIYFTEDTAPLLENEVALTQLALDRMGAAVGDTVHVIQGGETREYVVTGAYESMEMMGISMRFSETAPVDYRFITSIFAFQGNLLSSEDVEGQIQRMQEITPDYDVQIATEYIQLFIEQIITTVEVTKNLILVVVLVINCLITVLLMRSFLARDVGEIALLMSIGVSRGTIRAWQVLRIIIVLACSLALGTLISNLLNPLMIHYTFGIMGAANIPMTVRWEEVYLLYPGILFLATSAAALLSVGALRTYNLKDVGTNE